MARIQIYLDAESAEIAVRLGQGNVSAGIRKALKRAAASLTDARNENANLDQIKKLTLPICVLALVLPVLAHAESFSSLPETSEQPEGCRAEDMKSWSKL